MTTFDIPLKDEMRESLGQDSLSDNVYTDLTSILKVINDYEKPIAFEYVNYRAYYDYDYSIDPKSENANRKHKGRLDKLGKWNSDTANYVVGRIPEASVWLDAVLTKIGEDSVTSSNMNHIQEQCVRIGDERGEQYYEASSWEIQERALENVDFSATGVTTIGDLVDDVVSDVLDLATENLTSRINSRSQGGKSSAGSANEEISRRVLLQEGMSEGDTDEHSDPPFDFTTKTDDADIIVYSNAASQINVEVKSIAIRERVSRAFGDSEDWVLIGYFDNAKKIRKDIVEGNKQGEAWFKQSKAAYVPPKRITEIEGIDDDADDGFSVYSLTNEEGKLFLRSNAEFAYDMQHYAENGELPDKVIGHEETYL